MIVINIGKYLKHKSINVSNAEKLIGISNGSLSKPLNNNKSIKTNTLEKFLNTYKDVNVEWLLTGKGEMLKSDIKDHKKDDNPKIIDLLEKIIKLQEENASLRDELTNLKNEDEDDFLPLRYVSEPAPKLKKETPKHT